MYQFDRNLNLGVIKKKLKITAWWKHILLFIWKTDNVHFPHILTVTMSTGAEDNFKKCVLSVLKS